jgi:hypothetical protein
MIAPHVHGPFLICEWRERHAPRTVNPSPLILSTMKTEYNDRRDLSGLGFATRLRRACLPGKEEQR